MAGKLAFGSAVEAARKFGNIQASKRDAQICRRTGTKLLHIIRDA